MCTSTGAFALSRVPVLLHLLVHANLSFFSPAQRPPSWWRACEPTMHGVVGGPPPASLRCPSAFVASFVGSFVGDNGQGERIDKARDKARDKA